MKWNALFQNLLTVLKNISLPPPPDGHIKHFPNPREYGINYASWHSTNFDFSFRDVQSRFCPTWAAGVVPVLRHKGRHKGRSFSNQQFRRPPFLSISSQGWRDAALFPSPANKPFCGFSRGESQSSCRAPSLVRLQRGEHRRRGSAQSSILHGGVVVGGLLIFFRFMYMKSFCKPCFSWCNWTEPGYSVRLLFARLRLPPTGPLSSENYQGKSGGFWFNDESLLELVPPPVTQTW